MNQLLIEILPQYSMAHYLPSISDHAVTKYNAVINDGLIIHESYM